MRPSKLRTGIIFIGLGVALLLFNMDRLDGWYFADLLRLWPVLLVAIGVEVIARHSGRPALAYLSPVLIAGAFVFAGYGGTSEWGRDWIDFSWDDGESRVVTTERTFEADGLVDEARYYIDLYRGRLGIRAGGDGLGRGEFRSSGKVRTSISESDGRAVVRIRQSGASRAHEADFDVLLAERLPVTLDLKADDARIELDGQKIDLRTLYLEIESGDAVITLGGGVDSVWASLDTGNADIRFRLPVAAGLRILGGGITREDISGDFDLAPAAGALETEGFAEAPLKLTLELQTASPRVSFESY